MDDRARHLMFGLHPGARVVEIGPSYNPLAPKRDGWNTVVIDHETREGLIRKYDGNRDVDISKIEDVDYVWRGGSLIDLLGTEQLCSFDAFIASHVIEHTTDIVRFLQAATGLLRPTGLVILALPDKRKCFDFFRPISTTADAIVAYRDERVRHTAKTFFEHFLYQSHRGVAPGWSIDDRTSAILDGRIENASEILALADEASYVDAHAWTFTPASFELMILELKAIGLVHLRVERVEEAHYTEFYAWLRPSFDVNVTSSIEKDRLNLLNRMMEEQAKAITVE